jgi:DNA-binding CsgD family transcriptional regulator
MHDPPLRTDLSISINAVGARVPRIVGRDAEQALLRRHLSVVLAGQGSLVLVSGEAGIGKTTLVEAIAREALDRGVLVLAGHCYDTLVAPPYGLWIDLFSRYAPADGFPDPPDLLRPEALAADITSQDALFGLVRAFLARTSERQPMMLVLEDLHWADPAGLELLRFVARSLSTAPLLILGTYRRDEITRRDPLFQLLPHLVREARAERIDLRPLDRAAIRDLVTASWRLPPDDEMRLIAYLELHAEGNPLFVGELLRTLAEGSTLVTTDTAAALGNLETVLVPPLVRQVIEGRLARHSEELRDRLAIAAVIGHEVPLDIWRTVIGTDDDELLATVERAFEAGFLTAPANGTHVRFSHALIREALYEGILPPRRRAWHRATGEALAGSRRPDANMVASHFLSAGDERAVEWLIRAGELAQRAYDWLAAVNRFEEAIRLLEQDDRRARERGWLLYRVGKLLRFADTARGVAYIEEAARIAAAVDDRALAAIALFDQGMLRCVALDLRRGLAEMGVGAAALRSIAATSGAQPIPDITTWVADALSSQDQPARATGGATSAPTIDVRLGTYAMWLAWTGHFEDALQIAETCVTSALAAETVADGYADAYTALGTALTALGRPHAARQMFARGRAIYQSIGHHIVAGVAAAFDLNALLLYETERVDERRQIAEDAEAAWLRGASGGFLQRVPRSGPLNLQVLEGWWDEPYQLLLGLPEGERRKYRHIVGGALGMLAYYRGDIDVAWTQVRLGLPDGPATRPGEVFFTGYAPVLQRLATMLSIDADDLATARTWLDAHDRWLHWSGSVPDRTQGYLLWARYHDAAQDTAQALEHVHQALRHATEPRQPIALLAAHRALGVLQTNAVKHADAEQHLQAALTLADACAAPFERALTLLALAELRAAEGKRDEARTLAREVHAICEPLGARPTLDRVDALLARLDAHPGVSGYPAGLTAREVDVLRLVAQGLTDAEVAERLYMARRTVNTHLTSIYTKLDVSSRVAATRWAVERGLT